MIWLTSILQTLSRVVVELVSKHFIFSHSFFERAKTENSGLTTGGKKIDYSKLDGGDEEDDEDDEDAQPVEPVDEEADEQEVESDEE